MKKIIGLFVLVLTVFLPCAVSAHEIENVDELSAGDSNEVMPYGLIVSVSADIYEENGYVCGVAQNTFTLGFSRVYTAVLIYSSETYTENKDEMTYEAHNSIDDLNLGKKLIAKAEKTSSKWWRVVVRFKNNNSEWVYAETDTVYY